jgi:hypothetical protein
MNPKYNSHSAISVFFLSVAVIALQLMIMRALSVTHYYHFSYLVISTALLGFGASGTFLALFFDRLKKNFSFWNQLFFLFFVISVPAAYLAAQSLPLDTQYVLYSGHQLLLLIGYNFLMFIPFFFGGTILGFMISYFKKEVPELYAANLFGSGMGGVFALGLMYMVPATQLPLVITPLAFMAMIFFFLSTDWKPLKRSLWIVGAGAVVSFAAIISEPPRYIDPYKELAQFQQLERQGDAEQIEARFGPRGQLDIFSSRTFHYTLFAGLNATVNPPQQLALLIDGMVAGSIFTIEDEQGAGIMDFTPQSLAYRLLDQPDVLLLGEITGVNVWLAKRMGANEITVVQTNPQLIKLLKDDLSEMSGGVYSLENVRVVNRDPRLYLEQSGAQYDLIHLVAGEAMAVGTGGLQGLNEDFLLTTNAISRARSLLSDDGLISITRGIQSPPRDNIKLISLFTDAISGFSDDNPADHLLISRNYLAANTLMSNSPVSEERLELFREQTNGQQLDVEYYPGIRTQDITQMNRIDGPEGESYSYIHHAVMQILSENPDAFYDDWAYEVRGPTDQRPYFHDFFKWSSLTLFLKTYGSEWFQRLELGYVILVITFLQLSIAAFLLILLPLIFRRAHFSETKNKLPALLYFFCIGTGFMLIEISLIQVFTRFLGDPIFSAAAILSSILVFSGLGSYMQKRLPFKVIQRTQIASTAIVLFMLIYLFAAEPLLGLFIGADTAVRFLVTILLLVPVSFFFGWMFPAGIQILDESDEELIPWAWGVDGFASVSAAPLAIILSMSIGFSNVILIGIVCYIGAGLISFIWRAGA